MLQQQGAHLCEIDFQSVLVANARGRAKDSSCCIDDQAGYDDGMEDPIGRSWQKRAYEGSF